MNIFDKIEQLMERVGDSSFGKILREKNNSKLRRAVAIAYGIDSDEATVALGLRCNKKNTLLERFMESWISRYFSQNLHKHINNTLFPFAFLSLALLLSFSSMLPGNWFAKFVFSIGCVLFTIIAAGWCVVATLYIVNIPATLITKIDSSKIETRDDNGQRTRSTWHAKEVQRKLRHTIDELTVFVIPGFLLQVALPKKIITKEQQEKIELARREFLDHATVGIDDIPADLKNVYNSTEFTNSGEAIDGALVVDDFTPWTNRYSNIENIKTLYAVSVVNAVVMSGISLFFTNYSGLPFYVQPLVVFLITSPLAFLFVVIANRESPMQTRAYRSAEITKVSANAKLAIANGKEKNLLIVKALRDQAARAAKDKSEFFEIGRATGILNHGHCPYSPEKGMPVGLTSNDLIHTIVFGETGEGKTYNVARPAAAFVCKKTDFGMLVLDGKGPLPAELEPGLREFNYAYVTPENSLINPLMDIPPAVAARIVISATQEGAQSGGRSTGESNSHFKSTAEQFFSAALTIINKINSVNEAEIISGKKKRIHPNLSTVDAVVTAAITDSWDVLNLPTIKNEIENLRGVYIEQDSTEDDKCEIVKSIQQLELAKSTGKNETGSFLSTWKTVMSSLVSNKMLSGWANCEREDIALSDILAGRRIGVQLLPGRYGIAATVLSRLIKQRVMQLILTRDGDWSRDEKQKRVVILVDEAQEVIDREDAKALPMIRSAGGIMIALMQNVDGLFAKLGDENQTKSVLSAFKNLIALDVMSETTQEFVSHRAGQSMRIETSDTRGFSSVLDVLDMEEQSGLTALSNICGDDFDSASINTASTDYSPEHQNYKIEGRRWIEPQKVRDLTLNRGHGIVVLERAGETRCDAITFTTNEA